MPRFPRVVAVGASYHISQHGSVRRPLFETNGDRFAYLSLLHDYSSLYRLRILGYCLMPNHVQLIAVPECEDSLAGALDLTQCQYSVYRNDRQNFTANIWQEPYCSSPIDAPNLWAALRYIERSPVRAGLAQVPGNYPWSSANIHCTDGAPDTLLDLDTFRARWTSTAWREFIAADDRHSNLSAGIRGQAAAAIPLTSSPRWSALYTVRCFR